MKKGWEYKKLGEVANVNHGKNQKEVEDVHGKYPIYGSGGSIMGYANNYLCDAGTTILGRKGTINNPIFIETKFWNVDTAFGISAKEGTDKKYIYYFVKSQDWSKKDTGTTLPSLTQKVVKDTAIPIPPLSEQQRIVSHLDSAFAKIDAVAKNAENSLNDAKALFQSALTKMMELKEGWGKKNFGDICTFVRGPFGGSLKKDCFKESGYAVYEQQNAIYNRFSFRYFIDKDKYNSMRRFKVEPGDLIMSCSGTIGKVAIVPKDAKKGIINQALLKLTPSTLIDAEFLKYLMESNFFKGILSLNAGGAAINNIASVSTLKKIELSIPTVEEQREIVKKLNSIKKVFLNIFSNLTHTLTECATLKQSILRETFE